MIHREPAALRVNERRAGGTEAAWTEKDGGKQGGGGGGEGGAVKWKPGLRVFPW